jgi:hypothetical protein
VEGGENPVSNAYPDFKAWGLFVVLDAKKTGVKDSVGGFFGGLLKNRTDLLLLNQIVTTSSRCRLRTSFLEVEDVRGTSSPKTPERKRGARSPPEDPGSGKPG